MDAKEIAKEIGISEKHAEFILSRKRRPSPQVAVALEKLTGVERRAWIWPDDFINPMLSTSQSPIAEPPAPVDQEAA